MSYFHKAILNSLNQCILFTIVLLLFRILMLCYFTHAHFVENMQGLFLLGVFNELKLVFLFVGAALTLNFIPRVGRILVNIIAVLLLTFSALNQIYFFETFTYFTQSIMEMAQGRMVSILQDFGVFKAFYLLSILPILLYLFGLKRNWRRKKIAIPTVLMLFVFLLLGFLHQGTLLAHEQSFSTSSVLSFFDEIPENKVRKVNLNRMVEAYQNENPKQYISTRFPLLHVDSTESKLSPFFEKKAIQPNVVFIFVESLPGPLSCKVNDELSFTPFLDSLSKVSLKFSNFISVAERTFGVLPSVLASLPHSNKGFMEDYNHYPKYLSIPNYLKQEGYDNNFYYGGEASFDHMDSFMKASGIDHIYDRPKYKSQLTAEQKEVLLGIEDRALFEGFFDFKSANRPQPFLDVFLTLTSHFPFQFTGQQAYIDKSEEILLTKGSKVEVAKYEKYLQKLSTILYVDEMIKEYFNKIKDDPAFENTIFVIGGDHMMVGLPYSSPMESYNTPFLIYSPLLKRSKEIKALNSHLDLAPALTKLLATNFALPYLDTLSWLGCDMDTNASNNMDKNVLFMHNDRVGMDYLNGSYFINNKNKTYRIQNVYQTKRDKVEEIDNRRAEHRRFQEFICANNLIYPQKDLNTGLFHNEIHFQKIVDKAYVSLVNYTFKENPDQLQLKINLNFNQVFNEDLKMVICVRDKEGGNKMWEAVNPSNILMDNKGNWNYTVDYRLNVKNFQKGDRMEVYLWNNKRVDFGDLVILNGEIDVYFG